MSYDYYNADGEGMWESEAEEEFNSLLNEIHGMVNIGSLTFQPATVIKECDPTAYREEFLNWVDAKIKNHEYFESEEDYREWTE